MFHRADGEKLRRIEVFLGFKPMDRTGIEIESCRLTGVGTMKFRLLHGSEQHERFWGGGRFFLPTTIACGFPRASFSP
jgi:hypothetical protein